MRIDPSSPFPLWAPTAHVLLLFLLHCPSLWQELWGDEKVNALGWFQPQGLHLSLALSAVLSHELASHLACSLLHSALPPVPWSELLPDHSTYQFTSTHTDFPGSPVVRTSCQLPRELGSCKKGQKNKTLCSPHPFRFLSTYHWYSLHFIPW